MVGGRSESAELAPSRLDERVLSALQELGGRIAFSGLRRVLGAHPESLSRALRRLEREGLVERADGGYRSLGPDARPSTTPGPVPLRPVASVDLPPGAPAEAVLGRLTGRWFGGLRWVGVVERSEGRLLAWALRDGSETVLLGIRGGVLRVYVPARPGPETLGDGDEAAYDLLVHAVTALRPVGATDDPAVRFFRIGPTRGSFADAAN